MLLLLLLPSVPTFAVPPPWYRSNLAARILAAAAPSTAVWVFAVHAAGLFRWGIASGLCVGLHCAALTLKSISFAQQACPAWSPASPADAGASGAAPPTAVAAEHGGSCTAATTAHGRADGGPRTRSQAAAADTGAEGSTPASHEQGQRRGEDSSASPSRGPLSPPAPLLTFGEFVFFLLLAPSLVCEPRLLASSARLPRRVAAAASEFFHAGLVYLAVHVTCSAFFAPILRVLAAALHSGWADEEGWAELRRADGSGWWLHGGGDCFAAEDAVRACGEAGPALEWSGRQALTVAVAGSLGMLVLTPLIHFLMFYAFFHSVCLGFAELWGYPDRNIYGTASCGFERPPAYYTALSSTPYFVVKTEGSRLTYEQEQIPPPGISWTNPV